MASTSSTHLFIGAITNEISLLNIFDNFCWMHNEKDYTLLLVILQYERVEMFANPVDDALLHVSPNSLSALVLSIGRSASVLIITYTLEQRS